MWQFKHANTDHIRQATWSFNWEWSFAKNDVNEIVIIFNETISVLNGNYSYENIICDDQDPRGLITKSKSNTREKSAF